MSSTGLDTVAASHLILNAGTGSALTGTKSGEGPNKALADGEGPNLVAFLSGGEGPNIVPVSDGEGPNRAGLL
ncbi:hypothetical protein ABZ172_24640, partial [Streptomyces sp. NPDC006296]